MKYEKFDKHSGAILFKKDPESMKLEELAKEVLTMRDEIKSLSKEVKTLRKELKALSKSE